MIEVTAEDPGPIDSSDPPADQDGDLGGSGLFPDTGSSISWVGTLATLTMLGAGLAMVRRRCGFES